MTYQILIILTIVASALADCPKLQKTKHSRKTCETSEDGFKTCTFTCPEWTDMIGSSIATCSPETNMWSHPAPICAPNYSKCGKGKKAKIRCPKMTKTDALRVEEQDFKLTANEREIIHSFTQEYRSLRSMRGGIVVTNKMCSKRICPINCWTVKNTIVANICRYCRVKKIIKCKSSGSFFG